MSTGFKPGREINLVFVTVDGSKTDIGHALKPVPKTQSKIFKTGKLKGVSNFHAYFVFEYENLKLKLWQFALLQ